MSDVTYINESCHIGYVDVEGCSVIDLLPSDMWLACDACGAETCHRRLLRGKRSEEVWFLLQCVAVCCSVLQCVAVCCSVLQCVAVCCSVLQCVLPVTHVVPKRVKVVSLAASTSKRYVFCCSALHSVAVCYVAVCL